MDREACIAAATLRQKSRIMKGKVHGALTQPERATPADVGFVGNHEGGRMAGNRLPPHSPKWGRLSLCGTLSQRRDCPRHLFAGPLWDSAYVSHDPSLSFGFQCSRSCTTWLTQFACSSSAFLLHPYPWIIGTAFRTGFQILFSLTKLRPHRPESSRWRHRLS